MNNLNTLKLKNMIYAIIDSATGENFEEYTNITEASEVLRELNAATKESHRATPYKIKEQKDLFEYYEDQPEELQRVLKPYEEHNPTYESLKKILKEVQAVGYTFDYGLDAMPYNLRKM